MDRRSFVKTGLATGAVGMMGSTAIGRALAVAAVRPDIVAVKGADAFASTNKALQALGGIGRFVSKGSRVGLLINAPVNWWLEGSHTRMEVPLAVAKLCFDAGAKEVVSLPCCRQVLERFALGQSPRQRGELDQVLFGQNGRN